MRSVWMLAAAVALAACGSGNGGDARAAAAVAEAAPARTTADSAAVVPMDSGAVRLHIHPSLPPYDFVPHERKPTVVDSIVVSVQGRRVQTLRPGENLMPPGAEVERLSPIDLDFDGYADLAFLVMLAMANSRTEYWRFDPRTRQFHPAGEFETLMPDSAAGEHTSYNRGGHAGALWTAARWRWRDGRLAAVWEEEQAWLEDAQRYVRITRRTREDGTAHVRHDTLDEAEVRPGPSWTQP